MNNQTIVHTEIMHKTIGNETIARYGQSIILATGLSKEEVYHIFSDENLTLSNEIAYISDTGELVVNEGYESLFS